MCSRTQTTCIVCKAMYSRTHPHHANWCEFASCELMRVHERIAQVSATGERNVLATWIQTTSLAVSLAFSLSLLPFSNICSGFFLFHQQTVSIFSVDAEGLHVQGDYQGLCFYHHAPINNYVAIIIYQSTPRFLSLHTNQLLCLYQHIPINKYISINTYQSITMSLSLCTNQGPCLSHYTPINNYGLATISRLLKL